MDFGAALLGLFFALVLKLAVMGLCARLLFKLYGTTWRAPPRRLWLLIPPEQLAGVRVLWWALVLFAVSELTCGVELYILLRSSPWLSGTHGVISALGMGLFAVGMYLYLDQRFLHFAGRACIAKEVCGGCTVARPEGCRFRGVQMLLATLVALAAVPPLFSPTDQLNADPRRYVLPFPTVNAWYDGTVIPWLKAEFPSYDPTGVAYFIPSSVLALEFRITPLVVMALAAAAIVFTRRRQERRGLLLTTFAAGILSYTYLELASYRVIPEPLMGSLAHELAEFWFLIFIAEFLVKAFRPAPAAS